MLVISRRVNDSLVISNDVTITVVSIHDDKVRLGIECPMEMPVHRKEVWDAIRRYDAGDAEDDII